MPTRRQFLKKCALTVAASLAAPFLWQLRQAAAGTVIPIPVYHRVGAEADALTITKSRFAEDLQYLADNGYQTLTVDKLQEHIAGKRPLPDNAVFLTFDDGYLDNYVNVFPLLMSYGMTASFFVISARVGQPNRLSASQIMEMSAAGMCFGSHTVSHRPLATLAKWESTLELMKSKADIEDIIRKEVGVVAYPYGSYNDETIAAAKEAGYWGGFTVRRGYSDCAGSPLSMSRLPVFRFEQGLSYYLS